MKLRVIKLSADKDRFNEIVVEAIREDGIAGNLRISGASVQELFGVLLRENEVVSIDVSSDSILERVGSLERQVNEIVVVGFAQTSSALDVLGKQVAAIADAIKR